jgi:hypothetical protein
MPTNDEIQKVNDDLDLLKSNLNNIGNLITTQLKNKFSDLTTDTDEFIQAFEKGEDITNKLNSKLLDLRKTSNRLGVEKISLENDYAKALVNGNVREQIRLNKKLTQNKLSNQHLDKLQTTLITLSQIAEKEEKIRAEKEKQNSLSNAINSSLEKTLGTYISSVKEMLTLTGLFTFLINAAFKADAQVTELSKSLGISKDQARDLRQNIAEFSATSNDAFINVSRLTKAQAELSQQLGISVKFSNEELANFAKLTELTGLTAEEAGKLTSFAAATGKSTKEYTASIRTGAFYAQQATKTHFSTKQILQDVSKLSAGILIKFQGNPEAIAKSVVQAKALGTTLEQIDKTGESLLNFESSIENELKAELITGRQLNLERARAAALTGDQATLMQEVANQTGSLANFQNMNVIAQKSLAEAFGMSREEMAEMLIKQQAINKYGSEASQLNTQQLEDMERQGLSLSEYLLKQEQQQFAQDKFNNAITKLQDMVGNLVAGPLGTFIDMLSNAASSGFALKSAIVAIASLSLARTIGSLVTMAATLATSAIAGTTVASALTLGLGGLAIIATIASVASMMNSASDEAVANAQSVDDGIAPSSKGPFTITDAYGATAITAKGDGIAVSPNISRSNNINNTSIDLTPMITAINEVKASIDRLYSKNTTISMDGKAVGTTLTQGSYKFA